MYLINISCKQGSGDFSGLVSGSSNHSHEILMLDHNVAMDYLRHIQELTHDNVMGKNLKDSI